jgi:hypothetical protein
MADLGRAALVTSLLLLLFALVGGSLAAWKGRRRLAESARNALLSQDFEQFSNGDVQIEMNRPRKDGGPENADAWQALERVDDRTRCASWEGACRGSAKTRQLCAPARAVRMTACRGLGL